MPTDGKKGITVKVDAELHAEVRQYLEEHNMTMSEFVTLALQNELHPKIQSKEEKNMGNMRTLAFQVPEDLFQRIKDYLRRNNMTQKDFVIGLIEDELERDLAEREGVSEAEEPADTDYEEGFESSDEETGTADNYEAPDEEAEGVEEIEASEEESADEDESEAEEELEAEDADESEAEDETEDADEAEAEDESEDAEESEDEDEDMGFTMGM